MERLWRHQNSWYSHSTLCDSYQTAAVPFDLGLLCQVPIVVSPTTWAPGNFLYKKDQYHRCAVWLLKFPWTVVLKFIVIAKNNIFWSRRTITTEVFSFWHVCQKQRDFSRWESWWNAIFMTDRSVLNNRYAKRFRTLPKMCAVLIPWHKMNMIGELCFCYIFCKSGTAFRTISTLNRVCSPL